MNCLDLICRAMRRIGVIASGELPQQREQNDALETLKSIYERLVSDGAFGVLTDVKVDVPTYDAASGQRIIGSTVEITLPDTAPDCSVIVAVDPTTNLTDTYLFDASIQKWISPDDLLLTSTAPFAQRDANGLASMLAVELADEYGQQPSEITVRNAARWQYGLVMRWTVADEPSRGVYF